MKLAIAFVVLAACGGDKPAPAQPVSNQTAEPAQPPPPAQPDPDADRARAQQQADLAIKAAQEAQAVVDHFVRELEAMNQQIDGAVTGVANAQNDAERSAATARLKELQAEQADMRARVEAAKEAAMKAERRKGVKVSPACLDNPLARGC